jgi:hypothetical protein
MVMKKCRAKWVIARSQSIWTILLVRVAKIVGGRQTDVPAVRGEKSLVKAAE